MIELVVQWRVRRFDIGEVHNPTRGVADPSGNVDLDTEGVTVQARALVLGRDIRQMMGRIEREYSKDLHVLIVPRTIFRVKSRARIALGFRSYFDGVGAGLVAGGGRGGIMLIPIQFGMIVDACGAPKNFTALGSYPYAM